MNSAALPVPAAAAGDDARPAAPQGPAASSGHALLSQLGGEVAAALSQALEHVTAVATTGRISRQGLLELRGRIEQARLAGIMGQQIERLASGRVRQAPERVDLTALLRETVTQHRRQALARGIEVRQLLGPAQVMADPALMFTLAEALLAWALEHARARLEMRIELNEWPVYARLLCSFRFLSDEEVDASLVAFGDPPLRTISWRLLEQAARTMELPIRLDEDGVTGRLTIEFPRTVNDPSEVAALRDRADAERMGINSKPLAGSHLLVIAARRETRSLVRDAVRHMGLMIDYVNTVEEAREFCRGGIPHAVLHESALGGERFERLRLDLFAEMPKLVFIELAEDGQGLQTQRVSEREYSRVGRDAIIESLPAALMYELSRPR